jgi:6-phosphogluconolactonase
LKLVRESAGRELWSSLKLTWVDERVVPVGDAQSNRGESFRKGALSVTQPVALELPLVLDGEDGPTAAKRAAGVFTRDFGGALDVALLGIGEDGHVASLFPGKPEVESEGPVLAIHDSPKPPPNRVTLSIPVLARPGLQRIIVAIGSGKREAIDRLLAGDKSIPAARLGRVTLVTDQPVKETP